MAGEKTEKATPRRRRKAREEGQVCKSQDLNSAITLIVAFVILFVFGGAMMGSLKGILINNLSRQDVSNITVESIVPFLINYGISIVQILLPLLFTLVLVAIIANYYQVGPLFSPKVLKPNVKKLNPINGVKKIFSLKGSVEVLKGIIKVSIIGSVGFFTIYPQRVLIMNLSGADLATAGNVILGIIFSICWKVCIILFILGLFDYIYQKYEFEKSIKMTKQDVKDEMKNIEGNPLIKGKVKSIQRQMAQSRMMGNVPEADVIVTNPTHFAVALKYDAELAPAPIVIAKGVDLLAKKIKDIAKENKIPIVENKPLARSLYKLADVNTMVPEELFVAVAEVLAYIYKKNKNKNKRKKKVKQKVKRR